MAAKSDRCEAAPFWGFYFLFHWGYGPHGCAARAWGKMALGETIAFVGPQHCNPKFNKVVSMAGKQFGNEKIHHLFPETETSPRTRAVDAQKEGFPSPQDLLSCGH